MPRPERALTNSSSGSSWLSALGERKPVLGLGYPPRSSASLLAFLSISQDPPRRAILRAILRATLGQRTSNVKFFEIILKSSPGGPALSPAVHQQEENRILNLFFAPATRKGGGGGPRVHRAVDPLPLSPHGLRHKHALHIVGCTLSGVPRNARPPEVATPPHPPPPPPALVVRNLGGAWRAWSPQSR